MTQLTVLVDFVFGETVYLKTDVNQSPRIVTGHLVDNNSVLYRLQGGLIQDYHYDIEISREKDILLKQE